MYEAFFHLDRRPFVASPRTDHYFPARSIEQARQSLTRCISRCEGPGAIIGPSGTGKSLLCFVLAKQFRDKMRVVVVQGGRLRTRKSLLQNVLYELKQPFRNLDEDELRLSLLEHLEGKDAAHRRLLLVVDDSHLLRGQMLLDIAALGGHVRDGEPVIQFVLAGGSGLEERLAHPRLESLQQRIAARCYLQALSYDETLSFVRAQVEYCGGQLDQVISPDAVNALYRASDGVPRLINQIGDHALLLAYLAKLHPVNKAAIEEAWSDLQQLPTPWQVTDHPAAVAAKEETTSIVEFGSLEEPAFADAEAFCETENHQETPTSRGDAVANPVFSAEQNLWTIESGLARLHERQDCVLIEAEAASPIDFQEPPSWESIEESDMPSPVSMQSFMSSSMPESSSSMPSLSMPSVTLRVPSATTVVKAAPVAAQKRIANPFEDAFEMEEVVQDGGARKVGISRSTLASTPVVSPNANAADVMVSRSEPVFDEDRFEQFDGMSVDWMNYQATSVIGMGVTNEVTQEATVGETWNVVNTDGTIAFAGSRQDDRDAILVENDQPPRIRPVKRQEFRQLFAKMRGDN